MRNAIAIAKRELLSFFVTPVVYFVVTAFALLAGYFFFNLLSVFNIMMDRFNQMRFRMGAEQGPNLNQWVVEPLFFTLLVILVFLIPVLTMRLLAEEKRRGTFELLITSPLTVSEIVWGKFLGVACIVLIMLGMSFVFPLMLLTLGETGPDPYPVLSGFLGISLCALAFASIAMAVSAYTESQVVAAVGGMATLLMLYVINSPAEALEGTAAKVLNYISPVMQVKEMIRGVIETQSVIYFITLILIGIFFSQRALDAHRWR